MALSGAQRVSAIEHEDDPEAGPLPMEDFDVAVRLAHHAQRLKALETHVDNAQRSVSNLRGELRRLLRRQTTIALSVGGVCFVAALAAGFAAYLASSSFMTRQASVPAQAAAPVAPTAAAARSRSTPAAPAEAEAAAQESVVVKPVALGRVNDLKKEAAKPPPPRKISPFEQAVAKQVTASGQTVPEGWNSYFAREAKGDTRAKLQIAAKFLKGEEVKPDPAFAVTLIREAANSGNKEAMMWLGYSHQAGTFGKVNPVAAALWFELAAKAGVPAAYNELGKLYEKGVDGAPDLETALAWYQRGAASGDKAAARAAQRLNRNLLADKLLLSAGPSKPARAAAPTRALPAEALAPEPSMAAASTDSNAERAADIRAAQRMLKVLGYKIRHVDGVDGPETRKAIAAYQRDHAMAPDGQFSPTLLDSLMNDIRYGP